jgi:fructoselysine-6-P-deglycase FrlB-like protein
MDTFSADCRLTTEMLAAWPAHAPDALRSLFRTNRPLLLVGEGSSQLMPGGFLRACARAWGWPSAIDAVGGREVAKLDLAGRSVICLSNSGRSREVVEAMTRLPADACAVVGIPGGPLTRLPHHHLLPRAERAVPATASVFGTCLLLAQALGEVCSRSIPLDDLGAAVGRTLAQSPAVPDAAAVRRVFWLGGHAGVGSELALKTMEATGLIGLDLPGSLGLHGIHEVLAPGDLVVGHDISASDADTLRQRVETQGGARLLLPADPGLGCWSPLIQLVGGWRLLAVIAAAQSRDPATPRRATKVGNPVLCIAGTRHDA